MARLLVPFDGSAAAEYALDVACTMAAIDGDEVSAVYVIRVPPQLPISAHVPAEHARAEQLFERARVIADRYQASLTTMTVEARQRGPAIVEAAQGCDCIMVGQRPRRWFVRRWLVSRTLRYIVAHAPCQVLGSSIQRCRSHRFVLSSSLTRSGRWLARMSRSIARVSGGVPGRRTTSTGTAIPAFRCLTGGTKRPKNGFATPNGWGATHLTSSADTLA